MPPMGRDNLGGEKVAPIVKHRDLLCELCENGWIDQFVTCIVDRLRRRKHKFNCICQVVPMCPPMWAHWCHLANTIESSICGGDAVFCQNTLTTCCHSVVNMAWTKPIIIDISHKKKTLYSYFTMQILHNFQNSFTHSLSSKMCNKVIINKSTTCHTLLHYLSALWNINVQKLTIWNRHCDHIAWWYIWGVVGFLNAEKISKSANNWRKFGQEGWLAQTHLIPGHQGNVLPRTCPHGVWQTANVTAAANYNSILILSLRTKLA